MLEVENLYVTRARSLAIPENMFYRVFPVVSREGEVQVPDAAAFTAAVDGTITSSGHPLPDGTRLLLSTTETLPDGLVVNMFYYVINAAEDTFKLATTPGGTAVEIADTGTGTHTWQDASRNDQAFGWLAHEIQTIRACRISVDPTTTDFNVTNQTPYALFRTDGYDNRSNPGYVQFYADAETAMATLSTGSGWKVLLPGQPVVVYGKDMHRLRVAATTAVVVTVEPLERI